MESVQPQTVNRTARNMSLIIGAGFAAGIVGAALFYYMAPTIKPFPFGAKSISGADLAKAARYGATAAIGLVPVGLFSYAASRYGRSQFKGPEPTRQERVFAEHFGVSAADVSGFLNARPRDE